MRKIAIILLFVCGTIGAQITIPMPNNYLFQRWIKVLNDSTILKAVDLKNNTTLPASTRSGQIYNFNDRVKVKTAGRRIDIDSLRIDIDKHTDSIAAHLTRLNMLTDSANSYDVRINTKISTSAAVDSIKNIAHDTATVLRDEINNKTVEVNAGLVKDVNGVIGLDSIGINIGRDVFLKDSDDIDGYFSQFRFSKTGSSLYYLQYDPQIQSRIEIATQVVINIATDNNGSILTVDTSGIYFSGTTQILNDSTKLATQGYVDTKIDSIGSILDTGGVVTIIRPGYGLEGDDIVIQSIAGGGGVLDTTKVIGQIYWIGDSTITGTTLNKFKHTGEGTFAINCTLTDSSIVVGKSGTYEVYYYTESANIGTAYIYKNGTQIGHSVSSNIGDDSQYFKCFIVQLSLGDIITMYSVNISPSVKNTILKLTKIY